jgi:hypothetical protein
MAVRPAEQGTLLVWHLTHAIRQAEIQAELFEVVRSKDAEEKLDHLFEDCEARLRELEDHLCRWQMRDPDSWEPCEQLATYELKVDNLLETIGNVKLAVYKAREIEKVEMDEKVEKDEKDEKDEKVDMVDASTSGLPIKCNICGKESHMEKDCTFTKNIDCFRCGEKGHMSRSPLCKGTPPPKPDVARCTGKKHKNRPGWTRCKCKYCCKSGPCTDAQKTQEKKKVKFEDDEIATTSSGPEVSGATKPLEQTSDNVLIELLDDEPKPKSIMKSDTTTGETHPVVSIQVMDSVTEPPVKKAEPACSVTIQSHVRYHKPGGTTNKICGSPSAGERFVTSLETWNELVSSNAFRRVEDSVITDRCDCTCTGPPPPRYLTPPIPDQRTGTLPKEDADIDTKCQEEKKDG